MKRSCASLCLFMGILFLAAGVAEAKWWIFGKSEEDVTIEYLFINQIGFDESDAQITLYEQFLTSGMVDIRGKADVRKGKIGAVSVSLDGQKTWQDAKLASNGHFEFQFRPKPGTPYDLYIKVMDTLGRTNNVNETHKVITLSDRNMHTVVKEVLARLVEAYEAEDPTRFMALVAENFAGDELNLDYAVRRDFTLFDNIDLSLTISNIAAGNGGNIYATITYTRFLISSKSGQALRDNGLTEFVFTQEEDVPKIYSMKFPLIFGVSDAQNVATGIVAAPQNSRVLVVADLGDVTVVPFSQALGVVQDDDLDDDANDPNAGGGGPAAPNNPVPNNPAPNNPAPAIPTPTNLAVTGGMQHHFVDLEFESTLDFFAAQGVYETIVEESLSPAGPWQEVERKAYDTFVRMTTDKIAQEDILLYYRVKIEKIATGEQSQPSNVVQWDNR